MKMIIQWPLWRIRSYEYGFVVERRINPTRWKAIFYHNTCAQAIQSMFDYRVRTETTQYVVDAMDAASARLSTAKLVKKIDDIVDEIAKGFKHG